MPQFRTTRHLMHSAENMYNLVADVERYPEFVPLCQSLIIQKSQDMSSYQMLLTDMTIAYGPLRETITCHVKLDEATLEISTEAVAGPLREMENIWRFKSLTEATCEVEFYIRYEFRTRALQFLVGNLFDTVFRKFADAFEQRANKIYKS